MARTGPQKYPGASTAYWHQSRYPGSAMESNVIVWHSTEGLSLPSYGGGGSAPNFTVVPDFANRRLKWFQHFDFDTSSRALRNLGGGVETNTANVVQVEVVGTCDKRHATSWKLGTRTYKAGAQYLYTGALPDWAVRDLAAFAKWAHDRHGVPLTSGLRFKAYPDSYGSNGVRMSFSKWRGFTGHCGHQHVPENDHGDPGAFPMTPILTRAKGETDMPLTDAEIDKIAARVWTRDGLIPNPASPPSTNTHIAGATAINNVEIVARRVEGKVDALEAVDLTDAQIAALAEKVAAHPALAENIAELVAVKFAARLND